LESASPIHRPLGIKAERFVTLVVVREGGKCKAAYAYKVFRVHAFSDEKTNVMLAKRLRVCDVVFNVPVLPLVKTACQVVDLHVESSTGSQEVHRSESLITPGSDFSGEN